MDEVTALAEQIRGYIDPDEKEELVVKSFD